VSDGTPERVFLDFIPLYNFYLSCSFSLLISRLTLDLLTITLNHILAMDANSTHDPDTSCSPHPLSYKEGIPTIDKQHNGTLATSVSSCSLVDPLARQHSTQFPASRIRGLEHIDFILFTPCISSAVISSGCLSFHSLFNSDHRPYFLDLNAMTLFSVPAYEIQPALHRHLRLNDPRLVNQYRSLLYNQLAYQKIFEKVSSLQTHAENNTWT